MHQNVGYWHCSITLAENLQHPHRCWPHDWTRDQCATVAQLRMGHSPLLVAYLHHMGCRDSGTCPHCNGADETAEHLVLHCPAHNQARRKSWPNLHYPRRLWSFLEKIRMVTRPSTGNERESYSWRFGSAVMCWSQSTSYSTTGPVNTWMGDCLQAGTLSRYVLQPPRTTQPSIPPG